MKKIVYSVLATLSGLVLLFSYRTSLGEAVAAPPAPTASSDSSAPDPAATATATGSTSSTAPPTATGSSSPTATPTSSGLTDGTYTGAAADTRYGPVQVQITVSGGRITDVQAVDYPDSNGRDQQINERAIPQLVSETLASQSAGIDFVSGATYTSDGYQRSLQSALDEATS